jgi:hypothetical protein
LLVNLGIDTSLAAALTPPYKSEKELNMLGAALLTVLAALVTGLFNIAIALAFNGRNFGGTKEPRGPALPKEILAIHITLPLILLLVHTYTAHSISDS